MIDPPAERRPNVRPPPAPPVPAVRQTDDGPPAQPPRRRSGGGAAFDPYRRWLGVPPDRRPPTYYDLLGVGRGEDDAETLRAAAARRKAAVRPELAGEHADAAHRILYELEEAALALTDPTTRAKYDDRLKSRRRKRPAGPVSARVIGGRTAGEGSEIGRLFGTVVAVPGGGLSGGVRG